MIGAELHDIVIDRRLHRDPASKGSPWPRSNCQGRGKCRHFTRLFTISAAVKSDLSWHLAFSVNNRDCCYKQSTNMARAGRFSLRVGLFVNSSEKRRSWTEQVIEPE